MKSLQVFWNFSFQPEPLLKYENEDEPFSSYSLHRVTLFLPTAI